MKNLLFLHGFPFSSEMWAPQRAAFEAEGYRVIAPDLRLETSPATMDAMADAAVAALDAAGAKQAVVIGFSMGGYVAFSLLERYGDRVAALVLADTRAEADTPEGKENRRALAEKALREGSGVTVEATLHKLVSPVTGERRPEVLHEAERIMRSASPEAVAAASLGMAERPDRTADLAGLRVPVLVICGEDDGVTPPDGARRMAETIPGAALALVPEAGHLSNLERPELFNEALKSWLSKL